MPIEPKTIDDLVIEDPYTHTLNNEQFLHCDFITDGARHLIFTTAQNFQYLFQATTCLGDGTFRVVPTYFYQLYTLHCEVGITEDNMRMVPVVYCLTTSKTKATYVAIFEKIKTLTLDLIGQELKPKNFITDFEIGAIDAAKRVFPETTMHGCLFHLAKNVFRRVQKYGLQSLYVRKDGIFSLLVR
uniref:MULE transposase domain-containing protein n=1 Tax=Strigamia maritima TaxID=126957 RepID=T1IMW5_STRMM